MTPAEASLFLKRLLATTQIDPTRPEHSYVECSIDANAIADAETCIDRLTFALREIWDRRTSTNERGNGYEVVLDADLCDAIRSALAEPTA